MSLDFKSSASRILHFEMNSMKTVAETDGMSLVEFKPDKCLYALWIKPYYLLSSCLIWRISSSLRNGNSFKNRSLQYSQSISKQRRKSY